VVRSQRHPSTPANQNDLSEASLKNLAFLKPNQLLARVGEVELRSEDLRDSLQREFHGQAGHAGLSPEDLGSKIGKALDRLIEDELLAQAGRREGLKSALDSDAAREDLAQKYVGQHLARLPAVSDADLRRFYKNHGEKFIIPPSVKVRELFLPLRDTHGKKDHSKDKANLLGRELAARIRQGEALEALAAQHAPEAQRERAKVQKFRGGAMESADEARVLALHPGDVVGPLRVEGGYSVYQGVERVRSGMITFSEAKDKIRMFLEGRRTDDARRQLLSELQQKTLVQRFEPEQAVASAQ